ncbi:Ig-like domain-containing protein [Caballeronia sordidicola]|uniref:Ig-like domain-containing protein n=1 Tax=Caballeronia sordidicola TaxID=196367 RepID=UPI0009FAA085|nr:Ig-like domain-containing protein [Caballeronia sordidicola]
MAIQSTAPSQAIITSVGSAQSGGTADNNHPVITGKADAGTKVNVYDGVKLIGTADVGTDGTWSFTVPDSLTVKAGKHTFTAVSMDGDVWGATSAQFAVTLPGGAQVPNPPVVDSFTDNVGPVTGPITAGTTTDDSKPAMSGTGTAGDIIKLYDGDKVIGSATVDPAGKWTVQPKDALSDGAHDVHVTESNATGESGPTSPIPFTVDTVTPSTPVINGATDNVGSITGSIPAGGTTDDPKPEFSGKGDPGDTVTLYDGDTPIGSAKVDDNGDWKIKPINNLPDGDHKITADETNAAGNSSKPSEPIEFTVDTTKPSTPEISGATDNVGPVTGAIPSGGTTDDPKPEFSGKGDPGDTVTLYDGGTPIGSAKVDDNGDWKIKPVNDLPDGDHKITADETNAAGNTSRPSEPLEFTVDTTTPSTPVINGATDNVGPVTGAIPSGGTTDDPKPEFSGKGDPGDTVTLYDGDTPIGSAKVDDNGDWKIKPTNDLPDGDHKITADETNAAGNSSKPSEPIDIKVDTAKPQPPAINNVQDNEGLVTGPIVAGSTTDDTHPVVSGSGKAGDLITLLDGTTVVGSARVDENGKWSIKPTDLANGPHSLTATDTNAAGVTSDPSTPFAFTVLTGAPVAPTISDAIDGVGTITGAIPNNGTTDDAEPTFNGSGKAGDIIKLYDNGTTLIGSGTVDKDGNWSIKPTNALSDDPHSITATDTNPAGTQSPPSDPLNFTVDTSKPATPGISSITDNVGPVTGAIPSGGTTDDSQPTFSGTGKAGDLITILDNGSSIGSVTVDDNGTWSFKPNKDLPADNSITVIDTNKAGTSSDPSAPFPFTVDTSPATTPAIISATDAVGPVKGTVPDNGVTDDALPFFNGTGKAGDTVKLWEGTTLLGSGTVDTNGNWSIKPMSALSNATHTITATETNPAGNTGNISDPFHVTVLTGNPATPAAPTVTDNGANVPDGGTMPDGHPTISGNGTNGDVIHILDNGNEIGSVTVNPNGTWSYSPGADYLTPTVPHAITVKETNLAGMRTR